MTPNNTRKDRAQDLHILPRDAWPINSRGPWRHVYVVQEGPDGPVKIGIAANAFWRLSELQVGNHRRLKLIAVYSCQSKPYAFEIEKWAHYQLEEYHLGGEWFDASPDEVVSLINSRCV